MKRYILGIIGIIIIIGAGTGVWWLESRAQSNALSFDIASISNTSDARLTWVNPEIAFESIEVYSSASESIDGELVSTIESVEAGAEKILRASSLGYGNKTWYTIIGNKSSGQSIVIGKQYFIPREFRNDFIFGTTSPEGVVVIRHTDRDGIVLSEFTALDGYTGEVSIARADFNGDFVDEVIVVPIGADPRVEIYEISGKKVSQLMPYGDSYMNGFSLTTARLYNRSDATQFFALAPLWNGDAQFLTTVYRYDESLESKFVKQDEFMAYDEFAGGVTLTAGDVNGDGRDEIITSPIGGLAEVRIHSLCREDMPECVQYYGQQKVSMPWSVYDKIFPYGRVEHQDLQISTFDFDNDGSDEIIIAPTAGRTPIVKIYTCEIQRQFRCLAKELTSHQVYADNFTGGVNVTGGVGEDFEDTRLIVAPQEGGGPHVKVFDFNKDLTMSYEFFAYNAKYTGGVVPYSLIDAADGSGVILTTPQKNGGPHMRLYQDPGREIWYEFFAFPIDWRNQVKL